MKILPVAILTLTLLSCSKRSSEQSLTVKDWEILSNTHFGSAYINYPDSTKQTVFSENSPEFRSLLKALLPFSAIEGPAGTPFVEMTYFIRDPVTIEVRIDGEHLVFSFRNRWYSGGDAKIFINTLQEYRDIGK